MIRFKGTGSGKHFHYNKGVSKMKNEKIVNELIDVVGGEENIKIMNIVRHVYVLY